ARTYTTDAAPALDYSVVLFSPDPGRWTFPSRFIQLARPNQEGTFTLQNLLPDDYLVAAVPGVDGFEWQDPEVLEALRRHSTACPRPAGQPRSVQLRVVPPRR